MERVKVKIVTTVAALALAGFAQAQTAKPEPLLNPNTATETALATVPQVTPAIAKTIVAKRPFAKVTDLDQLLKEQKLTDAQLTEVHAKLFVPLDLNSATDDEILAIPGIGKRMLHEFKEYRPYKSMDQFRREIGKYIDKDKRESELARLERYVVIK
jgi:DNA uptake protein ComE-like DNA-binding protein